MNFQTTEAFDLYANNSAYRQDAASLTSVEGGKLDAHARREVSPLFVRVVTCVSVLAIVLFMAGGLGVALTSGTVALLQTNSSTVSNIKDIKSQNDSLRMERSRLTQSERISRIATQNLGMVYASDARVIEVSLD